MTALIAFFVGLFIGGFVVMIAIAMGMAAKEAHDDEV